MIQPVLGESKIIEGTTHGASIPLVLWVGMQFEKYTFSLILLEASNVVKKSTET
jgi:hypothetical protein